MLPKLRQWDRERPRGSRCFLVRIAQCPGERDCEGDGGSRNQVSMTGFKFMSELKITPKDLLTALQSILGGHKLAQVSFLSLFTEMDLITWQIKNI